MAGSSASATQKRSWIGRVVEPEEAAEVLLQPLVDPLERLEDRDRRGVVGQVPPRPRDPEQRGERERAWSTTATTATRPSRRLALRATIDGRHPRRVPPPSVVRRAGRARAIEAGATTPLPALAINALFGPHPEDHRALAARADLRVADADRADLAEIFGRPQRALVLDPERDHLEVREAGHVAGPRISAGRLRSRSSRNRARLASSESSGVIVPSAPCRTTCLAIGSGSKASPVAFKTVGQLDHLARQRHGVRPARSSGGSAAAASGRISANHPASGKVMPERSRLERMDCRKGMHSERRRRL